MNQCNKPFYQVLGALVKERREARYFTVAALAKEVGEQYKTIQFIERGQPCSMHHLTWMESILEIKLEDIYNYTGSNNVKTEQEESSKESGEEGSEESGKEIACLSDLL